MGRSPRSPMRGGVSNGARPADAARPACAWPSTCRGAAPSSWTLPPTWPGTATWTSRCLPRSMAPARQSPINCGGAGAV
eukprot:2617622-Alexandrium_andersonii.AAC.1